jgi:hypothetical protein
MGERNISPSPINFLDKNLVFKKKIRILKYKRDKN